MKKKILALFLALSCVLGMAQFAYAGQADADIARKFVVDAPHASEYTTENAVTVREYGKDEIITNGVVDPFFAGGGTLFAPVNKPVMKIYVIAVDFNDCVGSEPVTYGLQRNVFEKYNSTFDLTDPEIHVDSIFHGSDGLKNNPKFEWKGTAAQEYKGLEQLVEEMSGGTVDVQVVPINAMLAEDPENEAWPWIRIDGPMLEYAVQGPADCEDYRQFARVHQAAINAAYREIPDLDIEDIDFIYTIFPYNTHGYRSGLQGGSGLDTSFSYNDQSLLQRDSEYRHEPGVKTKGGRVVGSGVFGVKGIWGYDGGDSPRGAATTSLHEFTHGMGMFDDYSYGWMGANNGESTSSGVGQWGVMGSSMTSASPDMPVWRKFRAGFIKDSEIITILPGESQTFNIAATGRTDNSEPKMIVIPKEWRTRDTFGVNWNNGWNPNKTEYGWYDWFTNPWVGGETNAIKSFATFYTLEVRKPIGADSKMNANNGGVVVSYIANPTWETGHGAGGFKVVSGTSSGLKAGGTFVDNNIGLTVTVNSSNDLYDNVTVTYTGKAAGTSQAKHVYLGMLDIPETFATPGENFGVDFNLTTLGGPTVNDGTANPVANATRVGTPLGVPGGVSGYTMNIEFDATKLDYVSSGIQPFSSYKVSGDLANGKLTVTASSNKMIDKNSILTLYFKPKAGAPLGSTKVSGTITAVTLLNWAGKKLVSTGDNPDFDGVGTVGNGTFAAFHTNNSNTLSSNDIKSTGGNVVIGADTTYTLTGQITCDTAGPAPGTFIGVESTVDLIAADGTKVATAKSDWDGNYTLKGVPAGTGYHIEASKPKYVKGVGEVFNVTRNGTVSELTINRQKYTVTGRIFGSQYSDASEATPLAGAEVYLVDIGNAFEILGGPVLTDAEGNYSIEGREQSKTFVAVAVKAEGFGGHVTLTGGVKVNLGQQFGLNPADYNYPSGSGTLGVNGIYNFALDKNVANKNIYLVNTQDVHLRMGAKSNEYVYQLRDMNNNPVGDPVNSLGNNNGDDRVRNVAPGRYYIEVSRPGYITMCTPPFSVSTTRVMLRNNVTTNTMSLTANNAAGVYTVTGKTVNFETGDPVNAEIQFVNTNGSGVPTAVNEDGTFSMTVLPGTNTINVTALGYMPRTFTVTGAADANLGTIELEPYDGLFLSTDAYLVKPGKYFHLTPFFSKKMATNTAVLDFKYDKELFEYRGFEPAPGVTLITTEQTDTGTKFTVMIPEYDTKKFGDFLFSANEEADLQNEWHKIELTATYVMKMADGTKQIYTATVDTTFTSSKDVDILNPDKGPITLITLSNIIDKFGVSSADPEWATLYTFYDYNNDGIIDIQDITEVAKRVTY